MGCYAHTRHSRRRNLLKNNNKPIPDHTDSNRDDFHFVYNSRLVSSAGLARHIARTRTATDHICRTDLNRETVYNSHAHFEHRFVYSSPLTSRIEKKIQRHSTCWHKLTRINFKIREKQIRETQEKPQWIVAQRLLSALTIPGFK